ncbi:MAG: YfiR family protein [Deltaproteobacteria bacterium]|nr:YfiR family protein [Deltaproteobacteria bacterium]
MLARSSQGTAWRERARLMLVWLLVTVLLEAAGATEIELPEYRVKAAFLYNFAKFVDWPSKAFSNPRAAFGFCVLGEDPFGSDLEDVVKGKTVNERESALKRIRGLQGLDGCHIVFVSPSEQERYAQILRSLRNAPVLTVGETAEFTKMGGIISFYLDGDRIRLEINIDAGERAGLKISSRLLKLARVVRASWRN